MSTIGHDVFTSPRLRGEVDARSAAGAGAPPKAQAGERPLHPDPLHSPSRTGVNALMARGEWETGPARRLRSPRGLWSLGLIGVAGAMLSFVIAFALWIVSLGPPPLGEGLAFSTLVVDRDGRLLRPYTTNQGRWRLPATRENVDPRFFKFLLAYEDKRFPEHHGVDPLALGRAFGQLMRSGHIVSGASTLSMQVARLLEPRSERSFMAKLRQMVRAIEIERELSKDQILALYLSLAPYGGNLEGIRAASLAYFGKEPRRLTLAESALLVALPQSPEQRRPDRALAAAHNARDRVLDRFAAAGLAPADEVAAAKLEPVPDGRLPLPMLAPHSADAAVAAAPGRSLHRLTIDATLQKHLEDLARERARVLGANLSVAILAVDQATGEVLARVASADYLDVARAGAVDMTQALRSPGSTLKPFIYGLGFEDGIHPSRNLHRGPAGPLRRLCAGEFRSHLPRHCDGAARTADVVERAGRGRARQGRCQPFHGALDPSRRHPGAAQGRGARSCHGAWRCRRHAQ